MFTTLTIPLIIGAIALILLVWLFAASYVKSPPDTAFIISGAGKKKVITGKASFRIPFLQRIDKLLLKLMFYYHQHVLTLRLILVQKYLIH